MFFGRNPYADFPSFSPEMPYNHYRTTTHHRPADGGARVREDEDWVEVIVDAPGWKLGETTVEVHEVGSDRVLVASSVNQEAAGWETKELKVRVPYNAGEPAGDAILEDGVLSLAFERVTREPKVTQVKVGPAVG